VYNQRELEELEVKMGLIIVIGCILIVGLVVIIWVPKRQATKYNIEVGKKWQVENEFRKTIIQIFAGLVIFVGFFFAYQELKNFHISQKNMKAGQLASRFSKAIELLSQDDTKIGGIYALEQIAIESPANYLGTAIEVLSSFVRGSEVIYLKDFDTWKTQYAPKYLEVYELFKNETKTSYFSEIKPIEVKSWLKSLKEKNEELNKLFKKFYLIKPETQIAMTVLGRIRTKKNKEYWEDSPNINLIGVKLRGVKLTRANLTGANLSETKLTKANLFGADLKGANLKDTNLTGANLSKAKLMGAKFFRADLTKAYLREADLTKAYLREANLTSANLWASTLTEADLKEADLTSANLVDTKLTGANLMKADLTKTFLRGADLTNSNLWITELTGATLTEANLRGATLTEAKLNGANLTGADLTGADLRRAELNGANGLTVDQLLVAKTLFLAQGLPPLIEKELKEKKPELFDVPRKE
jgi:uncharacterized protein YjbI with pentapeptide repeats